MLPDLTSLYVEPVGPLVKKQRTESGNGSGNCESEEIEREEDESEGEESDSENPFAFARVYLEHRDRLVHRWGMGDEETFKVLHQLASLNAYQTGDHMSKLIYMHYHSKSLKEELEHRRMFAEIIIMPYILALMHLQEYDTIEAMKKSLPPDILTFILNKDVNVRRKLLVVESLMLYLLSNSPLKYTFFELDEDRELLTMIERNRVDVKKMSRDYIFANESYPEAPLVFEFVRLGMEAAFANPHMMVTIPPNTVLYHGSGIETPYVRRNKGANPFRRVETFHEDFKTEIVNLKDGLLSTTTDIITAYKFSTGCILRFNIKTELRAIPYASLPHSWNAKPTEREVLFPPKFTYDLDSFKEVDSRQLTASVGVLVYDVSVSMSS